MSDPKPKPRRIEVFRTLPIEDIVIRAEGGGRLVEALASSTIPYEVQDGDGHYVERMLPTTFDRHLSNGIAGIQSLFNHGMTIQGTPSERYAMPLGVPVEIRSDARGLVTVTRYSKTDLADEVLTLIRDGAIRGFSWSGTWVRGQSVRAGQGDDGLPIIERRQAVLREYGPTPFPAASEAKILSLRSASALLAEVDLLPADEREEFLKELAATAPAVEQEPTASEPAPVVPAETGPSLTQIIHDQRRRKADAERQ